MFLSFWNENSNEQKLGLSDQSFKTKAKVTKPLTDFEAFQSVIL